MTIEMAACAVDTTESLENLVDVIVSELLDTVMRIDLSSETQLAMTLLATAFDAVRSDITRSRLAYSIGRIVSSAKLPIYNAEHYLRWCIDTSKHTDCHNSFELKLYSDLAYIELATMTPWLHPAGLYPAVCKLVVANMIERGVFSGDIRTQVLTSIKDACSLHLNTNETTHILNYFQTDIVQTIPRSAQL